MPPGRRPHLLLFGWYREGTGFTRVLQALVPALAHEYDVTWMGVGYQGAEIRLGEGIRLMPTNLEGGDLVGAYAARLDWERLRPDRVLALNDIWYLEHYPREFGRRTQEVPMYGYLPLDGDIPDPELVRGLSGFSHLLTYTAHAAGQLQNALERCGIATPVGVVGHGVDLEAFYPFAGRGGDGFDLADRMARAARLFGLDQPTWVVLNASRPDPRKRIDLTIEGFARFARDKPGHVRLCLHQAVSHERFVQPLMDQARSLGIADRILWWPRDDAPLDDAALNELYNACAVGLNTSHGEGFGLVSFEHAATGAPQLLPAHAPLREIWGNAARLMDPVRPVASDFSPLMMGEVDVQAVADGLEAVYGDAAVYRRLANAGLARARQPDLDWSAVADKLLAALGEND